MHTAYILLGGNIGDRKQHLENAKQHILFYCGTITQQSSIYQTAAWGVTDQPDFYNQVIVIDTLLSPEALMQSLLKIEQIMGRVRSQKMGPRIIDLDILLIDDLIMETDILSLPHPAMTKRRFVLEPLSEISPDKIHPVEKKSITLLLLECRDDLNVQKIYTKH